MIKLAALTLALISTMACKSRNYNSTSDTESYEFKQSAGFLKSEKVIFWAKNKTVEGKRMVCWYSAKLTSKEVKNKADQPALLVSRAEHLNYKYVPRDELVSRLQMVVDLYVAEAKKHQKAELAYRSGDLVSTILSNGENMDSSLSTLANAEAAEAAADLQKAQAAGNAGSATDREAMLKNSLSAREESDKMVFDMLKDTLAKTVPSSEKCPLPKTPSGYDNE